MTEKRGGGIKRDKVPRAIKVPLYNDVRKRITGKKNRNETQSALAAGSPKSLRCQPIVLQALPITAYPAGISHGTDSCYVFLNQLM